MHRGIRVRRWDSNRRELWFQGELVKRFRVPAANQECILAAFEEENWSRQIDDPLTGVPGTSRQNRLQATVTSPPSGTHHGDTA